MVEMIVREHQGAKPSGCRGRQTAQGRGAHHRRRPPAIDEQDAARRQADEERVSLADIEYPERQLVARQGPQGGNNYAAIASPFNELHPAAQSRVADVVNVFEGAEMLQRLKQIAPDCAPPVISPN